MKDKILIIDGRLADFSTAEWGILKVVDGKVDLDKVKAFNRARLMLNSGANMFRVLRRGVWAIQKEYDWEIPGYWDILRTYLAILHQPTQGTWFAPGAEILVEIFDGCSEKWMYDPLNYGKARQLIRAMFSHLGDLPYVKFGVGNELNRAESIAFVEKMVYPEFKATGRIPFSYGATYSRDHDWVEKQKAKASLAWNSDEVSFAIYKQVHGIKDKNSESLVDTITYWVNHPLCTIWSVDGVKDGASECDYYQDENTKHTRPSPAQWRSAIKAVLDFAKKFTLSSGQVKFGFEWITKAVNRDECSVLGIRAISDEYFARWGIRPENWGKYPNDWVEPPSPGPGPGPEPPTPGPEPPPEPPSCYEKYIKDRPFWKWQLGKFIKCLFG